MRESTIHSTLARELPYINNKLARINHGGCGWFALTLHQELKRQGFSSSIVLVDFGYSAAHVRRLIRRMGAKGINEAYQKLFKGVDPKYDSVSGDSLNGHIALSFQGVLYDADGRNTRGSAISKHLTIKTMEQFLRIDSCWNGVFRHSNHRNDDIIGTFEKFFSNMFNEGCI